MEVLSDFKELLELFNSHKINYLVAGGYALAYHGLVNTQTVRLEEDGRISLEVFENVWAKDIDEHGTRDNEITGYKCVSSEELLINSKGRIKAYPNSKLVKSARASVH